MTSEEHIDDCLASAKWNARLHFWVDNDPVEEMKETIVRNSLNRLHDVEKTQELAHLWNLDLQKLAFEHFEEKLADPWESQSAMDVFRKFGDPSWITPPDYP